MTSAEQIKHTYHLLMLQKYCSLYNRGNKHEYFTVAHNANREAVEITLPSKGPWKVLVDGTQAGSKPLYVVHDNKIKVPALSSIVLKSEKRLNKSEECRNKY